MRILVLEDDTQLAAGLLQSLRNQKYSVDHFSTVASGLHSAKCEHYDLVLLDLGLPDADGFSFLTSFRKEHSTPVLILTARDNVNDKINGLDLGADDYLPKPFDLNELHARMRALLRRSTGHSRNLLEYGKLSMNTQSRSVSYLENEIHLSRREFNLLEVLIKNQGKVMTRTSLEHSLYSWQDDIESNALEVHIHNLRKKLYSELIKTVRGVGYTVLKS